MIIILIIFKLIIINQSIEDSKKFIINNYILFISCHERAFRMLLACSRQAGFPMQGRFAEQAWRVALASPWLSPLKCGTRTKHVTNIAFDDIYIWPFF